jgi:hypothetical protein
VLGSRNDPASDLHEDLRSETVENPRSSTQHPARSCRCVHELAVILNPFGSLGTSEDLRLEFQVSKAHGRAQRSDENSWCAVPGVPPLCYRRALDLQWCTLALAARTRREASQPIKLSTDDPRFPSRLGEHPEFQPGVSQPPKTFLCVSVTRSLNVSLRHSRLEILPLFSSDPAVSGPGKAPGNGTAPGCLVVANPSAESVQN